MITAQQLQSAAASEPEGNNLNWDKWNFYYQRLTGDYAAEPAGFERTGKTYTAAQWLVYAFDQSAFPPTAEPIDNNGGSSILDMVPLPDVPGVTSGDKNWLLIIALAVLGYYLYKRYA